MKIAIVNLSSADDVRSILEHTNILQNNIVDAKIDLFIDDELSLEIKEHKSVNNIFPLKLKNISVFDLNIKYDNIKYYARNKYDIAIDAQGSKTSAIVTYILSGKTTGFKNKPFDFLYDERIEYSKESKYSDNIKELFIKTFGLDNK